MRKTFVVIPVVLLAGFLRFDYPLHAQSGRGRLPTIPPQTASRNLSIDQEAEQQARTFWMSRLTKCGDSYYAKYNPNGNFVEYKGLSWRLRSFSLSQADRLNGVQYRGAIYLSYTASRDYFIKDRRWMDWRPQEIGFLFNNKITKYKGRWNIESGDWEISKNLSAVSCADALQPDRYAGRVRRQTINAEMQAMVNDAPNQGIYLSNASNIPVNMLKQMYELATGSALRDFVFTPNDGWIVTNTYSGLWYERIPSEVQNKFKELMSGRNAYINLHRAAFSSKGGWVIVYGQDENGFASSNIPRGLLDKLWELQRARNLDKITSIAFAPNDGWIMVYKELVANSPFDTRPPKTSYVGAGIPSNLEDAVRQLISEEKNIKQVAFTPNGGWIVLHGDNGFLQNNLPDDAFNTLKQLNGNGREIRRVAFAPNGEWIVTVRAR